MKKEPSIDYEAFIITLHEEFHSLKKSGSFAGIKHLIEIVNILRKMQVEKFIPRTAELLHYDKKDLEEEMKGLFDPFFASFDLENDAIHEIEKETGDFFALEKAYQLSHARRIWSTQIDQCDDVSQDGKNYFLSRVFIDCYETLPMVLSPIIKHHWISLGKDPKKAPSSVFEVYKFTIECLGKSVFSEIEIDQEFRKLRNDLSHASMLFKTNEILTLDKEKRPSKQSRFKVFPLMQAMTNLLVIYTTEMDIRLLWLAFSGKNDHFEAWMRYFEKYIYWFTINLSPPKR